MANAEEGKIDIGKLQYKLFAGPNGVNVLKTLIPGKSPTFRSKSPAFNYEETPESEGKRNELPTIKIDINLDEDNDKSDEEKHDEDNVLSSLCKQRPKKPGARLPSRNFVKKHGTSSSKEEVTFIINTNTEDPSMNIVDDNTNGGDVKVSSNSYDLTPPTNNIPLSPTPPVQQDQITTLPPVKYKNEDFEKQVNITLITKALQDRGLKKKENDSFNTGNVNSPSKVNHSINTGKPNDQIKEKNVIGNINSPHIKDFKSQRPNTPSVAPKPNLKKVRAVVKDQKIIKPSEIAKQERNLRNAESREQKRPPNMLLPKGDIAKTKTNISADDSVSENTKEEDTKSNIKKTNNEASIENTPEVGKTVCVEFKGEKVLEKTTRSEYDNSSHVDGPSLRSRINTRSLKKPEDNSVSKNEYTLHRTTAEGSKAPKTIPKLDRTQSEIPKLKKDFASSKSQKEKEELSNKTYLELETLKNINQKANEKTPQTNGNVLDGMKLPTQRSFGSIENVSLKRYQRIETSDYFNYKKSTDDVRLRETDKITDIEKNHSSDLFKSKADVLKDARTRERSNTRTEGKSNVTYVPYSAGKRTNTTDNIAHPTGTYRSKSTGARSNEASLLPRFKGTSALTSSVVTKSNIAKPCPSFPTQVIDRFMPKSNTTLETKRSYSTYS